MQAAPRKKAVALNRVDDLRENGRGSIKPSDSVGSQNPLSEFQKRESSMSTRVSVPTAVHRARVVRTLTVVLLAAGNRLPAADPPGFAREPVVVEYELDPSWPQRPEDVAAFGWVSGMDLDAQGNIWLFNKGPDPVQVYAPDGRFVRTWGKDQFVDPHQLRIDHEGNIWVADFGLHVVAKYTPDGDLLQTLGIRGEAGQDERHFNRPTDMAVTHQGDVFVTDGYGNRRIVHFDKHGQFVNTWGAYGSKPGEFVLPHAIVLDSRGRLFVADRNSGRIQIFSQAGEFLDQWDNLVMPWGLFFDARDELWVCGSSPHWWLKDGQYPEFKDQVFMRFGTDGRMRQLYTLPLGVEGNVQPGETRGVHCLAVDKAGNVYLGDIYGERAQKFVPLTKRP